MDKTIGALRQLLKLLHREQARDWSPHRRSRKVPQRAQEVWEELSSRWWIPIGERELEKLLSASDELHLDLSDKVLYLPPLLDHNSDFVPVLSLKCDIDEKNEDVELRIMLIHRHKDEHKLYGIGFRLESPEGKDSAHDFYHAQFIVGFGFGRDVDCPNWIPCTQPSFPLSADSPITLLLTLLITLYGKNYCWQFYNKHSLAQKDMKRYMDRLQPWMNWPSLA